MLEDRCSSLLEATKNVEDNVALMSEEHAEVLSSKEYQGRSMRRPLVSSLLGSTMTLKLPEILLRNLWLSYEFQSTPGGD